MMLSRLITFPLEKDDPKMLQMTQLNSSTILLPGDPVVAQGDLRRDPITSSFREPGLLLQTHYLI